MIRARRHSDVDALVDVLLAQRNGSGYPVSLPPDPRDLIVRPREVGAWVAIAGIDEFTDQAPSSPMPVAERPVGHVSLTRFPPQVHMSAAELEEAHSYARAHSCTIGELGVISALFTADEVRRRGIGKALFQHAVQSCLEAGLRPCLDVVVGHGAALAMYEHLGWEVVEEITPDWLPDDAGPVVTMVLRPPHCPL